MNNPDSSSDDALSPNLETTPQDPQWARVLTHVRRHVSDDDYRRWFRGTSLVAQGDNLLVVGVPNAIHEFFIESNFLSTLRLAAGAVLGDVLGDSPQVEFRVLEGGDDDPAPAPQRPASDRPAGQQPAKASPAAVDVPKTPNATAAPASALSPRALDAKMAKAGISPKHTFETYVVGASNQFASAAANQVSTNPGRSYNPLFICGGSGLGKTHLMHAIGRRILETKPKLKVLYVTGEQFTNDFIEAIREKTIAQMRKRYRKPDVLLIDDVQFIAGKAHTQEEFFHTFNALADGCRQIVLSSDRPPSEIPLLEKRLVSRFEWGLTASVQPPEMETRVAILQKKMAEQRVELEADVIHFIAEHIRHNVRRLEGALIRVASATSLNDKSVTVEEAQCLLNDMLDAQQAATVTVDRVQRIVAEHYDIRVADMTSKRRTKAVAFPRQIAMYLVRRLSESSYAEIGEAFGGRDHGTVMHGCKKIGRDMAADATLHRTVGTLEERLLQGEHAR